MIKVGSQHLLDSGEVYQISEPRMYICIEVVLIKEYLNELMTRAVGCLVKIGLPNSTDISVLHAKYKMSLEITESLTEKYIED